MSVLQQTLNCYYCGMANATIAREISVSFTANTLVRCPHSEVMCADCHSIMFGEIQRVWFFNTDRQAWVTLYMRGVSQVRQGDLILSPIILPPEEHTSVSASGKVGKPETLPVLAAVPTRVEMRDWLVNPPEPPFRIIIAESGQKHLLFLAKTGLRHDYFPVQFETDTLHLDHAQFLAQLTAYEALLALGFSKTEINSGEYRCDRLAANYIQWTQLDPILAHDRVGGKPSRHLQLISHVAQRPDTPPNAHPPDAPVQSIELPAPTPEPAIAQLSLF